MNDRDNSNDPTPYAVICHGNGFRAPAKCGLVFLDEAEYSRQMDRPDSLWSCPQCGGGADWDDYCQVTNPPETDTGTESTSEAEAV